MAFMRGEQNSDACMQVLVLGGGVFEILKEASSSLDSLLLLGGHSIQGKKKSKTHSRKWSCMYE